MTDCHNADIRDLLPEYLHERLDGAARAVVGSHLSGCADCQQELALLSDLRGSIPAAPALDLAAIASAIPAVRAPSRRAWAGWRVAAAVTVLVAGGSSIVVVNRGGSAPDAALAVATTQSVQPALSAAPAPAVLDTLVSAPAPVATPKRGAAAPSTGSPALALATTAPRELGVGGGSLTDLSDKELASLLKEIESLDALPTTDVDAMSVTPISPAGGRRGGE